MSIALTLQALAERIARPYRAAQNRMWARRARLGGRPRVAETLPEPVLLGDGERGQALVDGTWHSGGHVVDIGTGSIWTARLPSPRLEAERQSCLWLDDLAALGDQPARLQAQAWIQDWITRFGGGRGPGWQPQTAGLRAMHIAVHASLLSEGLDRTSVDRLWRTLAAHQRYLTRAWPRAHPGLPRLQALAGLVWSGVVLPHGGHSEALAETAALAEALIDPDGGTPSRIPEELAEILILLIWTARLLEDADQRAMAPHLSAIVRAVPTLRPLRMGDGSTARFHGGSAGSADRLDQALAELRLAAQPKPRLPMGYARLGGGRAVVLMDGAPPPSGPAAAAATLAFEMSVGRQPFLTNAGPGAAFGTPWALAARQTAAQTAVEVAGTSSARLVTRGLAARTFGPRLADGPALVSVRQAQDATGQWLLATQDGFIGSHGLLQERRLFLDARGLELRGEDILTVADVRARDQFERQARDGRIPFAARFHLHPSVSAEPDPGRALVALRLSSGEVWLFRAVGGTVGVEDAVYFDPHAPAPLPTKQVVVRAEVVEYLGQITWSFGRIAEAPR